MKVLIHVKSNSSFHNEMINWARVLQSIDCEVTMWDLDTKPAYDVFDEVQPDIFIGNSNVFTEGRQSVVRCLAEFQDKLKIVMKEDYVGDPVEVEIPFKIDLQYVGCLSYYRENPTMEDIPLAANIFDYHDNPPDPTISSDLCYINMDREIEQPVPYILPLCFPIGRYNIKIFDTLGWSNYAYMGGVNHDTACRAINSTRRLIVNHNDNSIPQVVWDARLCRVPMINCAEYDMDNFLMAIRDGDYDDGNIEYDHQSTLEYGTYFNRVSFMLGELGEFDLSDKCLAKKSEVMV